MGATLFTIEEAISFFHPKVIFRTFFTAVVGYVVLMIINQGSHLSATSFRIYGIYSFCSELGFRIQDFLYFGIIGALCGLMGALLNFLAKHLNNFRAKYVVPHAKRRILEVLLIALLTATIVVFLPVIYFRCRSVPRAVSQLNVQCTQRKDPDCNAFFSKPGCYPSFMVDNVVKVAEAFNCSISEDVYFSYCFTYLNFGDVALEAFGYEWRPDITCDENNYSLFNMGRIQYAFLDDNSYPNQLQQDWGECQSPSREYYISNDGLPNADILSVYYSPVASLFQVEVIDLIGNLFTPGMYDLYDPWELLVFLVVYFVLALLVLGSALSAGFVLPTLIIGASFGRLCGMCVNNWFKSSLNHQLVDPGMYAMIGAAGFWTGTSRATITIAVLMLEITGVLDALPGIMVSILMARLVGDVFNESLYHIILHIRKILFLNHDHDDVFRKCKALDIMSLNVVKFYRHSSVRDIESTLESCKHNGFPVVCRMGRKEKVIGLILRSQLLMALKRTVSRNANARNNTMDLSLYMDKSPCCITCTFPGAKAFSLFRSQGLRHLVVVNHSYELFGIITRKDLVEFSERYEKSLHVLFSHQLAVACSTVPTGFVDTIHNFDKMGNRIQSQNVLNLVGKEGSSARERLKQLFNQNESTSVDIIEGDAAAYQPTCGSDENEKGTKEGSSVEHIREDLNSSEIKRGKFAVSNLSKQEESLYSGDGAVSRDDADSVAKCGTPAVTASINQGNDNYDIPIKATTSGSSCENYKFSLEKRMSISSANAGYLKAPAVSSDEPCAVNAGADATYARDRKEECESNDVLVPFTSVEERLKESSSRLNGPVEDVAKSYSFSLAKNVLAESDLTGEFEPEYSDDEDPAV